jgi:MFS family permease
MVLKRSHKLTIFTLALVILIDSLTLGLVIPIFAALFNDPHGIVPIATSQSSRNFMFSMVVSLPMFAMLLGAPILGELSDRYGRKAVLIVSLTGVFLSCLASVLSFYVGSILILFISRIFVGLMDSSQAIAQAAIIDISRPDEKVKNMSLITIAGALGWIIGPIIGGFLADPNICSWFGYDTPFWAAAILALVNLIALQYFFVETREGTVHATHSWFKIFNKLFDGFADKRIILLSISFLALQFAWAGVYQVTNLLLAHKFHYGAARLGIFSTYIALVFALFLVTLLPSILRFWSIVAVARMGLFLAMVSCVLFMLWQHNELLIWLALLPGIIGMGMSYNTILALYSNAVKADEQGRVMGVSTGVVAIAWLLSGLYIGNLAAISYTLTFAGQALVIGLGFLVLLFYRAPVHEHSN